MRLKPSEVTAITETAREVFGERVAVWLFGSRADDAKRGGDIDLYVELPAGEYVYAQKVRFWCALVAKLGDQKIDIVVNKIGASCHLPIYDEARLKGVRL